MIITMKKQANILAIEKVIKTFQEKGFDVHIKNGEGDLVIAVLGQGVDDVDFLVTERLPGVKKIDKGNEFFVENHGRFVEAWQYQRAHP